jgi:hypothetical protein
LESGAFSGAKASKIGARRKRNIGSVNWFKGKTLRFLWPLSIFCIRNLRNASNFYLTFLAERDKVLKNKVILLHPCNGITKLIGGENHSKLGFYANYTFLFIKMDYFRVIFTSL